MPITLIQNPISLCFGVATTILTLLPFHTNTYKSLYESLFVGLPIDFPHRTDSCTDTYTPVLRQRIQTAEERSTVGVSYRFLLLVSFLIVADFGWAKAD